MDIVCFLWSFICKRCEVLCAKEALNREEDLGGSKEGINILVFDSMRNLVQQSDRCSAAKKESDLEIILYRGQYEFMTQAMA